MTERSERPSGLLDSSLFPFESKFLEVQGCRVHYIDEGAGPALVLLHGNPTWSFLYRRIIAGLRDRFRCIALDYPGFGLSGVPGSYGYTPEEHTDVVEDFLLELDLQDITLMGQDWGGPIGLTVATRHADRFSGFILGNTWAWPLNGQRRFELFAAILTTNIGRHAIEQHNAFVNVMMPLGTKRPLGPEVKAAYRDRFPDDRSRRAQFVFARSLMGSRAFMQELYDMLAVIRHLPLLLVWGRWDFALRKGVELKKFEALFRRHHTVVLDAGHFIQEDAPDNIVAAIRGWWPDAVGNGLTATAP